MPELEYQTEETTEDGSEVTTVEIPSETGTARVRLPADAGSDEVAALVAAVATRLRENEEESTEEPEESDRWSLAGRFDARRRYELPRECRRGGEWKAAARCP